MRLTRVHVDMPLAVGLSLALPADAARYLQRVLRLQAGDACVLFNGDGCDHDARITHAGKRELRVEILATRRIDNESPLHITLLQGLARGEKMDLILQKATELGVRTIVPVQSQRSEVKLDGARAQRRVAHWHGVLASACAQSGRARLPEISAPQPLATAVTALPEGGTRLLLDPDGRLTVAATGIGKTLPTSVALAVGPEGGWSPRDRECLQAAGFQGLRLGPRVLRTETAGLAAIAALQALHGDLGSRL